MSEPADILVIRRDNIGDLVCTTPLLTALRKRFPKSRIGVLANSYNAPVLEGNPDIDDIHVYRKLKHVAGEASSFSALAARLGMIWGLRRRRIGVAIVAAGSRDFRALRFAKLLAVQEIVCADGPVANQHEVERTFTAARRLGIDGPIPGLRVVPNPASSVSARERLRAAGVRGNQAVVAMHISARRPAQRWQAEKFAQLSVALHREFDAATLLLWSPGAHDHLQHPGDDAKATQVQASIAGKSLVVPFPTATLPELVGALSVCTLTVCSDGGAMHLAAGLGKPIVCFFGDSDIDRWRPWGVPHVVLHGAGDNVENIAGADAASAAATFLTR